MTLPRLIPTPEPTQQAQMTLSFSIDCVAVAQPIEHVLSPHVDAGQRNNRAMSRKRADLDTVLTPASTIS
jgi:hypothetical protein